MSEPTSSLERLPEAEATLTENEEPDPPGNLNCIIPAVNDGKEWNILVYGIDESERIGNHHMELLCGILGEQISYEKRTVASFHFEKNGVTVTVHMGKHDNCNVTSDEIDLLLYFMPVKPDCNVDHSCINDITRKHGAMIWKHSVAILTGMDANTQTLGNLETKFNTLYEILRSQIQGSLENSIQENEASVNVSKTNLLIQPAGRRDKPDLPKPYERWHSLLWYGCFLSSKEPSIPAILKVAQDRISYNVKTTDLQRPFHLQPIQTKEKGLSHKVKLALGLGGGGGATAVGVVTGGTIGGLIGALAFGVPTFGIAAKTGLAIGVVVGAGVGVGAASAVGTVSRTIKKRRASSAFSREVELSLHVQYGELLTYLPSITSELRKVARGQVTCRIVLTGIEGEHTSQVAAALTGKRVIEGAGSYWRQVVPMKANLVVYDVPRFPKNGDKTTKAKKLIQATQDTHLLIFCIPMTYREKKFVYSPHADSLRRLRDIDKNVFSNMVIALTNAHNLGEQADFKAELERWKIEIRELLKELINLEDEVIQNMPILPVGDGNGVIEIPATERQNPPEQYYWLTELLLHAMRVTKHNGLPTMIKWNNKLLPNDTEGQEDDVDEVEPPNQAEAPPNPEPTGQGQVEEQEQPEHHIEEQPPEQPDIDPFNQQQQLVFQDVDNARELIIRAQCDMFSRMGQQNFEPYYGEAIGLILGENDEQDW